MLPLKCSLSPFLFITAKGKKTQLGFSKAKKAMEELLEEGVAFLERVGVPRDHVTALVGPFREGLIEKKRVRLQKIGGMGWVEAEAELRHFKTCGVQGRTSVKETDPFVKKLNEAVKSRDKLEFRKAVRAYDAELKKKQNLSLKKAVRFITDIGWAFLPDVPLKYPMDVFRGVPGLPQGKVMVSLIAENKAVDRKGFVGTIRISKGDIYWAMDL